MTNFEAEQACWPNYYQPAPPFCRLPLYPTSASAHCALIQRRINLFREVLTATARFTDDMFKREDGDVNSGPSTLKNVNLSHSKFVSAGGDARSEQSASLPFPGSHTFRGDLAADLLGPFIELASSAQVTQRLEILSTPYCLMPITTGSSGGGSFAVRLRHPIQTAALDSAR